MSGPARAHLSSLGARTAGDYGEAGSALELGLYRAPRAPKLPGVPEIKSDPRGVGLYPTASGVKVRLRNELEAAIARSQDHLLDLQKPEGYWVGELMVDSTLVSDMVAYHHWAGDIDP